MKKHVKIYCEYFGYGEQDFIPSEISGKRAADTHHLDARGLGGSDNCDYIENLMALTREEHEAYGDREQYMDWLKQLHLDFMKIKG